LPAPDRLLRRSAALLDDVIVAVSTPPGRGAIGIVRLSGSPDRVHAILAQALPGVVLEPRRATLATLVDAGGLAVDRGLVTRFVGPASYTGEDVVELALHGSPVVLELATEALRAAGARPAGPGEFTRRAVQNGRMGLLEAEAVDALVRSESARAARLATRHLGGELSSRVAAWRRRLVVTAATLEALVDFPEDVPEEELRAGLACLPELRRELADLALTFDAGRRLVEGTRVVLAGPVNAGKSTLFNLLLGHDRAITSEVPGTTRDVVSEVVGWAGRSFRLEDTAGLRSSDDPVEVEGIARTVAAVRRADVEVVVRDGRGVAGPPPGALAVATRADLLTEIRRAALVEAGWLPVGAPGREGVEAVRAAVVAAATVGGAGDGELLIHTVRQHEALTQAVQALDDAVLAGSEEAVLAALAVRAAGRAMEELAGQWSEEGVLDALFERFCVGK
jgi:tRNA modification GTPase